MFIYFIYDIFILQYIWDISNLIYHGSAIIAYLSYTYLTTSTISFYLYHQSLSFFLPILVLPPLDPILSPGVSSSASRLHSVALMSLGGLVDIPGWGLIYTYTPRALTKTNNWRTFVSKRCVGAGDGGILGVLWVIVDLGGGGEGGRPNHRPGLPLPVPVMWAPLN